MAPRTHRRRSVATWSLRERAVCRRRPGSPTSSVRRASTFMWMSSSAAEKVKVPASISRRMVSSPSRMASSSAWDMIPWRASMALCAVLAAMSSADKRRSKPIEGLMAAIAAAGPPVKRPPQMALGWSSRAVGSWLMMGKG